MNEVFENARDRDGRALHDYITGEIEAGEKNPGIDWHDAREYDQMAEKVLAALWGESNIPLVHAQFTTGEDCGLTGFQPVDVAKVEVQDDGSLTVTLNYWPKDTASLEEQAGAWSKVWTKLRQLDPNLMYREGTGIEKALLSIDNLADVKSEPVSTDVMTRISQKLGRDWQQKKDEMAAAWLNNFGSHNPADMVLFSAVECGDVHGEAVMIQKFWIEPKPKTPDFDAIKDKRMSEMTDAQKDDAMELWLRNNVGWFGMGGNDAGRHIEFLLKRIDELRGVKGGA